MRTPEQEREIARALPGEIRGVVCVAGNDLGPEYTHIAPHLARAAAVVQERELWTHYAWIIAFELEVRDGAIRQRHGWFYDAQTHLWRRDAPTAAGERVSYHFARESAETSVDWYIFDQKPEVLA